jgi:hypothetical protein
MRHLSSLLGGALAVTTTAAMAVSQAPRDLAALLRDHPAAAPVLAEAKAHRLQILVAEPVVADDGTVTLVRSRLGDEAQYFYPASAIKLCGAIAALLAVQEVNRESGHDVGLQSALAIAPRFPGDVRIDRDASNVVDGTLTFGHALRKLFLVSDNAAYNHCFELCGRDGLNRRMHAAGFTSVRLWHRLSEARTAAENAQTRAVTLRAAESLVAFPARDTDVALANDLWHELDVGKARLVDGKRVDGPMSFAQKNAIRLDDLQDLLVEVVRPEIDTGKRGFPELGTAARAFVVQALGELPRESTNPRFDPAAVPDHACKFVLRGVRRVVPAGSLRVYDKIGRAYGFSVENAWVEDTRTGRGFFLAVVLYTNRDGVLNDDAYDYETVADPFLDAVGEVVARVVFASEAAVERDR